MEQKKGGLYFYMAVLFSLGVLAYSLWLIFGSVTSYSESQTEQFYYSLILGLIGIALSISSLSTMRRRIQVIKSQSFKTFSIEFCEKCSFKKLREFKLGDYVHQKVGACPQCGGDLRITAIYAESPKE
jgi:hypothetical protein